MLALAAAELGFRCHVYCPDPDPPAAHVSDRSTIADYCDQAALQAFAAAVDVVTYEFENVPAGTAAIVDKLVPLRPSPAVLATCQDRLVEKTFLEGIGVATAPWRAVESPGALAAALAEIGRPAVLKSARYGYDGKGQIAIDEATDLADAWQAMTGTAGEGTGVLERWIAFEKEISVVVVRGIDGAMAVYVPVENVHENHILRRTIAPAEIAPALAEQAAAIGKRIADALDLIGVLAIEMFVTGDGTLLVNELAPRPHNSGHWTIDACIASQFEQCVRAIAGLPLAATERHSDAVMENLLGDEAAGWLDILKQPAAKLHLYGKQEARPGRKMGHVTRLIPRA